MTKRSALGLCHIVSSQVDKIHVLSCVFHYLMVLPSVIRRGSSGQSGRVTPECKRQPLGHGWVTLGPLSKALVGCDDDEQCEDLELPDDLVGVGEEAAPSKTLH